MVTVHGCAMPRDAISRRFGHFYDSIVRPSVEINGVGKLCSTITIGDVTAMTMRSSCSVGESGEVAPWGRRTGSE